MCVWERECVWYHLSVKRHKRAHWLTDWVMVSLKVVLATFYTIKQWAPFSVLPNGLSFPPAINVRFAESGTDNGLHSSRCAPFFMSPTRSAFLSTFSLALTWSGKWPQVTRWKRGSFSVLRPSRLAVYHQLMLQLCFVNSSCFHGNQCLSWLETMHSDKVKLSLTTTCYHYHHHIQCTPIKWIYHSLPHVTISITVSSAFWWSEFVTHYHTLPLPSAYPMHSDQVNLSLTTTLPLPSPYLS